MKKRDTLVTEIKAALNEGAKLKRWIDGSPFLKGVAEGNKILQGVGKTEDQINPYEPYETAQDEMRAWAERSTPMGVVMDTEALRQRFPDGMER